MSESRTTPPEAAPLSAEEIAKSRQRLLGPHAPGTCAAGFPISCRDEPCSTCGATSDNNCGRWVVWADEDLPRLFATITSLSSQLEEARRVLTWQPIECALKDEAVKIELGIIRKGKLDEIHIGGWRESDSYDDDDLSCWWSDQADDEITPQVWRALTVPPSSRLSGVPSPPSAAGGEG